MFQVPTERRTEMAVPKRITKKAEQLERALAQVARLGAELEGWYACRTSDSEAMDFFHMQSLDNPYEFDLASVLQAMEDVSEGRR
jgi:hypothetical protein